MFFFSCKLYSISSTGTALPLDGFGNWPNTAARLLEHEKSAGHLKATTHWLEADTRFGKGYTIDALHQQRINDKKIPLYNVFQRLLAIVQFLAGRNVAFRGSADKPMNLKMATSWAWFSLLPKLTLRQLRCKS